MANTSKTDAGFGKMLNKTYIVGIFTATSLAIFPLAALANPNCCKAQVRSSGDNAVIQTSDQQATVSGSGNRINQNASQTSNSRGRVTGNQGIVQDQSQFADSSGHGNRVRQNLRQNNSNRNQSPSRSGVRPAATCYNSCSNRGI